MILIKIIFATFIMGLAVRLGWRVIKHFTIKEKAVAIFVAFVLSVVLCYIGAYLLPIKEINLLSSFQVFLTEVPIVVTGMLTGSAISFYLSELIANKLKLQTTMNGI